MMQGDLRGEGEPDLDRSRVCDMTPPVLPRRRRDAHKGDFGRVLILGGSVGFSGAPALAARAAVSSGAGLVTAAVPPEVWSATAGLYTGAMVMPWPADDGPMLEKAARCDAVLVGPGLGQSERARRLTLALAQSLTCPLVIDADGLNILAGHIDSLTGRHGPTILTPHEGEFARLTGCVLPVEDRVGQAADFARRHGCTLVLKGHRTVTAGPDGACTVNTTGNPGMARGGSGDALSGLILSLLGQGFHEAAAMAVWLHGRAGDLAAGEIGEYGMTVDDLIAHIPAAMKECEQGCV